MKKCTDSDLIDRARNGDHLSYAALVDCHYMTVYRYAFKWCRCKEDAEDITQEVFIRLVDKIQLFDGRAKFTTWLYRLTANCAKDYARKSNRWMDRKLPDPPDYEASPSANPGPEDTIITKSILTVIDLLPDKLKEAVLLIYAEGLNHKEAAEVIGCAETTVSWRIYQAKRKLRKILS